MSFKHDASQYYIHNILITSILHMQEQVKSHMFTCKTCHFTSQNNIRWSVTDTILHHNGYCFIV